MPHDQWIEMAMNEWLKMEGGWIGIINNEAALEINTKAINNIIKMKESIKSVANIKNRQFKHIECSPAQMMKDAKTVEKLINVMYRV